MLIANLEKRFEDSKNTRTWVLRLQLFTAEDRLSLPVRMADIAYPIMRSNPLDSYLDIEVCTAAKDLNARSPPVRVPSRECSFR